MIILTIIIICILIIIVYIEKKIFYKTIIRERRTEEKAIHELSNRFKSPYENFKNIKFENLQIKSKDGFNLKGYLYEKYPNSKKTMIIVHGYTAHHIISMQFMDMFLEKEFNILLVDVRGHGDSEGVYATYGVKEKEDLDLWVNQIKSRYGAKSIIGLQGQSMGAATVLMYGKNNKKVDFIIADSPYSTAKAVLKTEFKKAKIPFCIFYPITRCYIKLKCGFDIDKVSPIDDIKESEIPIMIVHGTGDRLVPYEMGEEIYNNKVGKKKRLLIVEGAEHVESLSTNKEMYMKAVREFIDISLKK